MADIDTTTFRGAFKSFFLKLISVKVAAFIVATILIFQNKIDQVVWCVIAGAALGLREVSKYFSKKFGG